MDKEHRSSCATGVHGSRDEPLLHSVATLASIEVQTCGVPATLDRGADLARFRCTRVIHCDTLFSPFYLRTAARDGQGRGSPYPAPDRDALPR